MMAVNPNQTACLGIAGCSPQEDLAGTEFRGDYTLLEEKQPSQPKRCTEDDI